MLSRAWVVAFLDFQTFRKSRSLEPLLQQLIYELAEVALLIKRPSACRCSYPILALHAASGTFYGSPIERHGKYPW